MTGVNQVRDSMREQRHRPKMQTDAPAVHCRIVADSV
jgi:hypothetical protein